MARLKAYTLGNSGFVSRAVLDAIGEPSHIRQATVTIVAETKTAAYAMANSRRIRITATDPEFRVTASPLAVQLIAFSAGTPMVYVSGMTGSHSDVVVGIAAEGTPWPVGRAVREDGALTFKPWED